MYDYTRSTREPLFNYLLTILLSCALILLVALMGMYGGYVQPTAPAWMIAPTPTATPIPPPEYNLLEAKAFFATGRLLEAVSAYEDAIQKDPTNDTAMIEQSRLLVYTKDTGKAVVRGAQAVALNPNDPRNLAYYCRALDWEARYEEAFEVCFCAIEEYPDYAEGYAFLSEIYTDLGNVRSAKEYAQQAIDLDNNSLDAHFNMGYVLEVQGEYDQAAASYDRAIEIAPNIASSYIAAGLMYHTMGQYRQYRKQEPYISAIERFKAAIKLRPFDAEAYARLGWTYYFDGQYGRAIDALEQGLGVDPTYSKGWGYLATVYYTRQRYEDAAERYPKAIELAQNDFLRRARTIEIFTEVPTAHGLSSVPILRGDFEWIPGERGRKYQTELEVVPYLPSTESDIELNCAELIAQSIRTETVIVEPETPITFTELFSLTEGFLTLDLETGMLEGQLNNLPPAAEWPYEIKMTYWPGRTDSLGEISSDVKDSAILEVQFDEKLDPPVEYYYQLGLAYTYLRRCDEARPWLAKAVRQEPAAWNPAWHGFKSTLCPPTAGLDIPPTPIPTATPLPTATRRPG
ncbi:tetratricopeptide repeat protein [Anaerolineales bacterium HSG6]|nr:tetratricopeptide repeat protein [Anaerolineales bacterium HSG6]